MIKNIFRSYIFVSNANNRFKDNVFQNLGLPILYCAHFPAPKSGLSTEEFKASSR